MRTLLGLLLAVLIALGLVWFLAGRAAGPAITLGAPTTVVGQRTPLKLDVHTPGGTLTALDVSLEQNGQTMSVGALAQPQALTIAAEADRVAVTGEIGRQAAPALKTGPATLVVRATRPVLFGLCARSVPPSARTCRSASRRRPLRCCRSSTSSTRVAPRWWSTR